MAQSVRVPSMSDKKKRRGRPNRDMVRIAAADNFPIAGPSGIGAQLVPPRAGTLEPMQPAVMVGQPAFPANPLPPHPAVLDQPAFPGNPLPAPPPVVVDEIDQPAFPGNPFPPPPIFGPACPTPFRVVPVSPVPQFQLQLGQEQVPQFHMVDSSQNPG